MFSRKRRLNWVMLLCSLVVGLSCHTLRTSFQLSCPIWLTAKCCCLLGESVMHARRGDVLPIGVVEGGGCQELKLLICYVGLLCLKTLQHSKNKIQVKSHVRQGRQANHSVPNRLLDSTSQLLVFSSLAHTGNKGHFSKSATIP